MWRYNDVYSSRELYHYGVLGMRWGVRRYQNPDGSLTPAGRRHLEKQDTKWANKNYKKIVKSTRKSVSGELNAYSHELMKNPSARTSKGKLSAATVNAYNRKMAELMNVAAKDITAPSGRVVRFVAKRGEVGVHMALADSAYNLDQLKNGVWASGRIAYKKKSVRMT